MTVKRIGKPTFFIVVALIALFSFSAVVGLDSRNGDIIKTLIKGVDDVRLGIDIQGGVDATFEPADGFDASNSELEAATVVVKTRLSSLGITDSEVYSDTKSDRIIVRFPWEAGTTDFDPDKAVQELGTMAELTFRMGTEQTTDATGKSAYTSSDAPILTGADVESAEVKQRQSDNTATGQEIVVTLDLKESGKEKFRIATQQAMSSNVPIAIWMDDTQISAPMVNEVITDGSAVITGDFTYEEAKDLADKINGGALPFKMEVTNKRTITPTMGSGSLNAILLAAAIAFGFIAVYMIFLYRLPGVVAVIALIGQITGSIAFVTGWFGFMPGSTLTIPGIAGIILAVGMGVDANIITGERIKEELKSGKSLDSAIKIAYKKAFSAILDGNVTNVLIAIILMGAFGVPSSFFSKFLNKTVFAAFGATAEGFVYSFGFTLLAGVILNFVMGVFAARLMVTSLSKFNCFKNRKLYGGDEK